VRVLLVYESMFGNTRTIAEAVAQGFRGAGVDVDASEVTDAPPVPDDGIGLLVVGAPTHALSLSRPESRRSAGEQGAEEQASTGPGLRDWLESLPRGSCAAAAFDTHIDKRIPGSASKAALRRLRKRGYRPAMPAESFYVSDVAGPLVDGEVARARRWAEVLAATMLVGHAATDRPPAV
jgi:hypothetical protein